MDIRHRTPINITIDRALIREIDEWVAARPFRTSRSAFFETAARELLAKARVVAEVEREREERS